MIASNVPKSITIEGATGASVRGPDTALGRARRLVFDVAFTVRNGSTGGRHRYRLVDSKHHAEGVVIRFTDSLAQRVTIQIEDRADDAAKQAWSQLVSEGTLRGWVVVE